MTINTLRTGAAAMLLGTLVASFGAVAAEKVLPPDPARSFLGGEDEQPFFGRFIITYKEGTAARNKGALIEKNLDAVLARTQPTGKSLPVTTRYLRKLAGGSDLVRVSRKLDRVAAEAFMRQVAADPTVAKVAIDHLRRPVRDIAAAKLAPATFTPSDPYFGQYQWHLKAPDGAATYYGSANAGGANVANAWDLADGNGIVIAVLDTGITAHPDIDTSLADAGYDFITDSFVSGRDSDARAPGGWDLGDWTTEEPWLSECTNAANPPDDSSWHGTHVASTAGAELTNNGVGMAGIAYNAKILPVRVLGHCGGYDSDINDAIVWAAGGQVDGVPANAHPAQVINLSLGGSGACPADDPQAQAIAQANALGAVVVVSAGNSGANAANYSPASCPGAIAVAATGVTSRRAYYSNYGAIVKIAAPGGGVYANDAASGTTSYDGFVWQALNNGTTSPTSSYSYGGYAGTSQAAPHVSGVVALMQGARLDAGLPLLTPTEVLDILQATAHVPSVAPSASQPIGAGIVDAAAAVEAAVGSEPCTGDCGPAAIPLANKAVVSGLSGAAGSETLYSFQAEAGKTLSILTYGGSGDVSVYVGFGKAPTTTDYDARSTRAGNSETVRFDAAQAGTYYIKLVGAAAYSGVSLSARQ
jgi:serine protease